MRSRALEYRSLAVTGAIYLTVLMLASELYRGSDAAFLFGSLWVMQALVQLRA